MIRSTGLLITAALMCMSCSSTESTDPSVKVEARAAGLTPAHVTLEGVAPDHLVVDGAYSDVRFCEMMAPHHRHAVEMAEVLLASGEDLELRGMAARMIAAQKSEIEELATIKTSLTGSSALPAMMSAHTMQNGGVPTPAELPMGTSTDLAFLDGMLPHHSGAIQMATVALRHSQNGHVVGLARRIIDDQAREIGEMGRIRRERYAGANHGFPHADGSR